MIVEAIYVSVWDGSQIRTSCKFNTETREVTDVETLDTEGMDLNSCEEEFVELSNGEIIKNFTDEDGNVFENGERVEESAVTLSQDDEEKEFDVPVVRTSYSYKTFRVKAKSSEQAQRLAVEQAGNYEFSEKNVDYSAEGAIEIGGK